MFRMPSTHTVSNQFSIVASPCWSLYVIDLLEKVAIRWRKEDPAVALRLMYWNASQMWFVFAKDLFFSKFSLYCLDFLVASFVSTPKSNRTNNDDRDDKWNRNSTLTTRKVYRATTKEQQCNPRGRQTAQEEKLFCRLRRSPNEL